MYSHIRSHFGSSNFGTIYFSLPFESGGFQKMMTRGSLEASISSKGMKVVQNRDVTRSVEFTAEAEPEKLPIGFTFQAARARAENPVKVITHWVKIINWRSGERYAFPGVGSPENDWAIPCRAFRIEDIVGQYLIKLEESSEESGLLVRRDATKKPLLSNAPVRAFISIIGMRYEPMGSCQQ